MLGGDGRYWNTEAVQIIIKMCAGNGVSKVLTTDACKWLKEQIGPRRTEWHLVYAGGLSHHSQAPRFRYVDADRSPVLMF